MKWQVWKANFITTCGNFTSFSFLIQRFMHLSTKQFLDKWTRKMKLFNCLTFPFYLIFRHWQKWKSLDHLFEVRWTTSTISWPGQLTLLHVSMRKYNTLIHFASQRVQRCWINWIVTFFIKSRNCTTVIHFNMERHLEYVIINKKIHCYFYSTWARNVQTFLSIFFDHLLFNPESCCIFILWETEEVTFIHIQTVCQIHCLTSQLSKLCDYILNLCWCKIIMAREQCPK